MKKIQIIIFSGLCSPLISDLVFAASTPPEPSLRKSSSTWLGYALMFLFFAIVVSISLMSSKRGHQD